MSQAPPPHNPPPRAAGRRPRRAPWALLAVATLTACGDTGQELFQAPLSLTGTSQSSFTTEGGAQVELSRADLAFGPLTLCAGSTAGTLCETARAEWLGSAVVSLISDQAQPVGQLQGVTGWVLSYMYELGLSSQLTRSQPFVLPAAADLDGASLQLKGVATFQGLRLPFTAAVKVAQGQESERGVPVVMKGASEDFEFELTPDAGELTLQFSAQPLIRGLDFSVYVTHDSCAPDGPTVVCSGSHALRCDDTGAQLDDTDCAASDGACQPGQGCVPAIEVTPDSQAYRQLRNTLMAGHPPTFHWERSP